MERTLLAGPGTEQACDPCPGPGKARLLSIMQRMIRITVVHEVLTVC